ncbi:MAG TPA: hypothetical protein VF177_19620 [Anaerolineae bacterium]
MKRYFLIGLGIVTILVASVTFVLAQETATDGDGLVPGRGPNYIDADDDGICDNCSAQMANQYGRRYRQKNGFIDEDGDGTCDNCDGTGPHGPMNGRGAGFVDEDGDGICDNCAGPVNGARGPHFVDADGDGVCDLRGEGPHGFQGEGPGNGRRGSNANQP